MKTPPFGKPLKDLIHSGQTPTNSIYLFIGQKAWDKGKSSSIARPTRTLILPPHTSPFLYDWPVNGCDILMIETTSIETEFIEEFANLLLTQGAIKVLLVSTDFFLTKYELEKEF